ncbi:MAG: 23S rRNA (uracil-5-)-methyltransferase RumA [Fusobacteria bacterium]|nr:MAG: 23S rRNA (uracil-5-)-methyltransferase RumA [Fusobacteriota bacterium]KAF0229175.1 MAG: 23S rRNA (uracil-5-)-methyltransferase [Fusobacteriota bacterium]
MSKKVIKGKVAYLTEEGKGVVKIKGKDLFVPYVLPGEFVSVEVVETRTGEVSRLLKVETPSVDRVKPPCPYFYECGGCQLQHMNYSAELSFKENYVKRLLSKFGDFSGVIGMENPWYYRNKVISTFGYDRSNRVVSGIYSESSHRLVPIDVCLIEDEVADKVIATIRKLVSDFKIRIFDEDKGRGFLRHVVIRSGHYSGEVMVTLVVSSFEFPSKNNFVKALVKKHPEVGCVVLNLNKRRSSVVLGHEERVIYGKGFIEDALCGLRFGISSRSFYQINSVQTEILYNKVIEFAGLTGEELVLDAYCGVGTIGMVVASRAKRVIGVEINADAVKDAKINARRNDISNISFVCADASDYMVGLTKEGIGVDVVLMDPPRDGSDERFLEAVLKLKPKRVVYVSCGPYALARDLEFLTRHGEYRVAQMVGVDLFPHTYHVETVVKLERQ